MNSCECMSHACTYSSGIGRYFDKGGSTKKGAGRVGDRAQSMRRRAVLDASGKLWSFSGERREAGRFRKVAGMSIVAAAYPCSAVDTSTVDSPVTTSSFNITT